MQNRLSVLSIALLIMITSAGCWHKKCCKNTPEESSVERVEEIVVDETEQFIEGDTAQFNDEEFPAASENVERTNKRVSGPSGWKQGDLK